MKSRYSPVAPIALMEDLYEKDSLGNYLLLLAHEVLEYPERFKTLLNDIRTTEWDEPTFIILDNSVIELGRPMASSELQEAYKITKPDCIVLPDSLGNAEETVMAAHHHTHAWAAAGIGPFMAVPQGETVAELFWCFSQLAGMKGIRYWGVPRIIANTIGTRLVAAPWLGFAMPINPNVHLMGMSNDLADDLTCASLPGVMGIDSANPCVLGQLETKINLQMPHMERGEYWNSTEATEETLHNIIYVNNMIRPKPNGS